ncbi:MAG: FtsQ-type POTRA domain-containing protein [Patescibacteria group bacterium]|nr:FtsQ-type POTRA domain-containing protein [Patescibacteria group bacterium]
MRKYRKPHRIKKKQPFFKKKYFFPTFFGFLFSILIIYLLVFSSFFQIENIVISGNEKTEENEILKIVESKIQKTMFFYSTKSIFLADINEIKKIALNSFPQIDELEIKKSFPKSLNVIVIERLGLAVFCNNDDDCFLLDQEAVIFEPLLNESDLPRIEKLNDEKQFKLGEQVIEGDLVFKILKVFSVLTELDIKAEKALIVSNERINVLTNEGWEIYFNPQKDLNWQLTKLEALLKEHVPLEDRSNLDYVELRFGDLAPFKYK